MFSSKMTLIVTSVQLITRPHRARARDCLFQSGKSCLWLSRTAAISARKF